MKKFIFVLLTLSFFVSNLNSANEEKPNLFVVCIGVDCQSESKNDNFATDAVRISGILSQKSKPLYNEVYSYSLTADNATHQNIINAFEWLANSVSYKDVAIVFVSSHGGDRNGFEFYPFNYQKPVLAQEIKNSLSKIEGKLVLILDTCHAGAMIRDWDSNDSVTIICACRENEYSYDPYFEIALNEGLSSKADFNKDGMVTVDELNYYLIIRMEGLIQEQHVISKLGINIPLIFVGLVFFRRYKS